MDIVHYSTNLGWISLTVIWSHSGGGGRQQLQILEPLWRGEGVQIYIQKSCFYLPTSLLFPLPPFFPSSFLPLLPFPPLSLPLLSFPSSFLHLLLSFPSSSLSLLPFSSLSHPHRQLSRNLICRNRQRLTRTALKVF